MGSHAFTELTRLEWIGPSLEPAFNASLSASTSPCRGAELYRKLTQLQVGGVIKIQNALLT